MTIFKVTRDARRMIKIIRIFTQNLSMTTKLNLTIEKQVVDDIKKYAKKHSRSVSEIVENQLKTILNKHSNNRPDFSKKYAGIVKGKKYHNVNKMRDDYLKEKYDL